MNINEIDAKQLQMKMNLVDEGIFPIKYDHNGNLLKRDRDTGYSTQGTIQGEGKLSGIPCIFIRTSNCQLTCAWKGVNGDGSLCDTHYSSWEPEKNKTTIEFILATIYHNVKDTNIKHVVISGGEPFVQVRKLRYLVTGLKALGLHVTIESNGIVFDEEISKMVDLISLSPKLSNSTPHAANLINTGMEYNEKRAKSHETQRRNIPAIQSWIDSSNASPDRDFHLKFVVTSPQDIDEIKRDYLDHLTNFKPEDIMLMPEGITPEDLMERSLWISEACVENGFRFCPRLHALLFGIKRGV